ncbi:uncharacterized protein LOC132951134 [Metopolophium dirhodum]|uniref:uncharacterized protein LOC132951134 n=1 Tax=Metopolophium dirhodum TaxID=44670 RepID=UPI0029907D8C|nr:uncharacterized protein LOC132951134 [Metopolophium dirhodum]
MAFKEIAMLSSLVVVTIISYNVLEGNAQSIEPLIDQDYCKVKAALYDLGEIGMNLMDDSQTLNDMQREYFAGKVDYSAVERARNELNKTKNKLFLKLIKYIWATNEFEPTINYQTTDPQKLYKTMDDLENYKESIDEMHADLLNSMSPTLQPTVVGA